jgi:hypothetical protein
MSTMTEAETSTLARVAASRAESLRAQAASLGSESLAPLRKALLIRAAELDLAADVLLEPAGERPHLQAIA